MMTIFDCCNLDVCWLKSWSQILIHQVWRKTAKQRVQDVNICSRSGENALLPALGGSFNAVDHTQSSGGRPQKHLGVLQWSLVVAGAICPITCGDMCMSSCFFPHSLLQREFLSRHTSQDVLTRSHL